LILTGGQAYSWKRLKIAIYALSDASKIEKKGLSPIFSYHFNSDCYAGPDDDSLRFDLDWLIAEGYLSEKTVKLPQTEEHTCYILKRKGVEKGLAALGYLNESQKQSLTNVANFFQKDSSSVISLLKEYARVWDESKKELVKKLSKEDGGSKIEKIVKF
jgi:hypothetical protein